MYFRANLKMKKDVVAYVVVLHEQYLLNFEFNFTVAFLLIWKTWDDKFAGKVGGWRILRNRGILIMGDDTPLPAMYDLAITCSNSNM